MIESSTRNVDAMFDAVRQMHINDQYALYSRLYEVLHGGPDGPDVDDERLSPEWIAEINRRVAEEDAGLSESVPWEDVKREMLELLAQSKAEKSRTASGS